MEAGTLYGRDAWGLETLPAEPAQLPDLEAMMTLSLTADLKAAELQFPRRYHTPDPGRHSRDGDADANGRLSAWGAQLAVSPAAL
ncbi:MAG: hypothetical protein M5U34_20965 [Chloroflexi bacterium]|nr:hypothetical protein [Chloroflexota bacterium]